MNFARRVFWIAGIYGVLVISPQLFIEGLFPKYSPPEITHPEFYYGFVGLGLAWQIAFLLMSQDPQRYRPLMIAAMIEKFSFGLAVPILFALQRVSPLLLGFASIDLIFGALFIEAYRRTKPSSGQA